MGEYRNHRMALPVLYFREEGTGHTQGGGLKRHSSGDTAFHAQLDREVFGTKLIGCSVAGNLSVLTNQKEDGLLHQSLRDKRKRLPAQLKAITPSTLDPETLTLLDPACGSGHILVEAYDLFKEIYLERGYRAQEVAQANSGEQSLRSRH